MPANPSPPPKPRRSPGGGAKEDLSLPIARTEVIRLAKHILELNGQLIANEKQLDELVKVSEVAPLMEEKGFGAISAATCLTAWSHKGRVRNEAAFASLTGVNPSPAWTGSRGCAHTPLTSSVPGGVRGPGGMWTCPVGELLTCLVGPRLRGSYWCGSLSVLPPRWFSADIHPCVRAASGTWPEHAR